MIRAKLPDPRKRVELDSDMLRGLQLVELELLCELDRICRKHDIPYCIVAGTMLGAVRHGGFIPWDDDADVAMLRPDYERFREVCAVELDPDEFYFQDHEVTQGYRWGYGKLRRKGTLFLREHQEHMPYDQGVFIDVFPLDSVPDSRLGRTLTNFKCFCIRKVLWSPVGAVACKTLGARKWFELLSRVPEPRAKRYLNKMISRASSIHSRWVRILMFPTPNKEYGYFREWYETPVPTTFEGVELQGVSNPDEYLRFKFGDYMKMPPENQRKSHPVSGFKISGKGTVA